MYEDRPAFGGLEQAARTYGFFWSLKLTQSIISG